MGPNVGDDNLLKSTSGLIWNFQMYVFPFKSERVFASLLYFESMAFFKKINGLMLYISISPSLSLYLLFLLQIVVTI